MNCGECQERRDPNLKYCGNCGVRQLTLFGAFNLYWIVWLIVLVLVYLGESALVLPTSDAGSLWIMNYILLTWVTTIVVVLIYMYGGKFAETIGKAIHPENQCAGSEK